MTGTILIADDETELADTLAKLMLREGLTPVVASDGPSALTLMGLERPDVLLLDFRMPGMNGMEVLRRAKQFDPNLPVILITAFADLRGAVEAIRAGAHDYISKPFNHHDVVRAVSQALNDRRLKFKRNTIAAPVSSTSTLREILGPSDVASSLIADIHKVGQSNFNVLILGETGTGKEVIARAIHQCGARAHKSFVPVDCGAIPEALFESELFGHERGAFTGANSPKPGKFEVAQGGTLFLDEISNMPLPSQAKLLRVLQERTVHRLGSTKPTRVDVQLLAASNDDLQRLTASGAFRLDLYYRLNEFVIRVPPLRERKQDIPHLAKRFMDLTNLEISKRLAGFTPSAMAAMLAYRWPGNVRELRSLVRRAVLIAEDLATEQDLGIHPESHCTDGLLSLHNALTCEEVEQDHLPLREIVRRNTAKVERQALENALRKTAGNKSKAARLLQIDYKTIHSKIKDYEIQLNESEKHA